MWFNNAFVVKLSICQKIKFNKFRLSKMSQKVIINEHEFKLVNLYASTSLDYFGNAN